MDASFPLHRFPGPEPGHGVHRARSAESRVLWWVAWFGHLRPRELALLVWPSSPTASGQEMARRTLVRLHDQGLLLERRNLLGGKSYVLTKRGAENAQALGVERASPGFDLAVRGPGFYHRTLATHSLASRGGRGEMVWGEYALAKGAGPVSHADLKGSIGKLPDGLVLVDAGARHGGSEVPLVDWLEVESSYKPARELEQVLQVGWKLNLPLASGRREILDRLILVFDSAEMHEARIRRAAIAVARKQAPELAKAPVEEIVSRFEDLLGHVDLVRLKVLPPLRITGTETLTLLDSLREKPLGRDRTRS